MTEDGPDKALGKAATRNGGRGTGIVRAALADAGPAVRRYLFAMGATWADAEDLAQDALLKAWRGRGGFDGRADVRTWLFSIARNHWRDRLRKRGPERREQSVTGQDQLIDPGGGPPAAAAQSELAQAVSTALRTLPGEQREALALRESRGLSFNQIGRLLDVSPNTIKSRVRYALLKLADELKPFAPENASPPPPPPEPDPEQKP